MVKLEILAVKVDVTNELINRIILEKYQHLNGLVIKNDDDLMIRRSNFQFLHETESWFIGQN